MEGPNFLTRKKQFWQKNPPANANDKPVRSMHEVMNARHRVLMKESLFKPPSCRHQPPPCQGPPWTALATRGLKEESPGGLRCQ